MKFSLESNFLEELYYDQAAATVISDGFVFETKASLDHEFGNISYQESELGIGSVLNGHYRMDKDLLFNSEMEQPCLEMHFNLTNPVRFGEKGKKGQLVAGMEQNLLSLKAGKGFVEFEEGKAYETFDIHLSAGFLDQWHGQHKILDQFIKGMNGDASAQLFKQALPVTPAMKRIISEMKTCPFSGLTRKIFLEAKVHELFALQLDLCDVYANIGQKQSLKSADIEKIHAAKNYITLNSSTPCSIIELAHKVGTNDFKLKKGFKELFGTTVFGYLQQVRMEEARQFLQEKEKNVGEIAELLGYQNLSNFTAAFKQYWGYPPSTILKGVKNG
ncbi:helix-turn-helix transcriptional regulator [Pedobacter caeni]|uniref:Transcriptional regulator, AraC family n=1 Tax=Pedobacter caeni TaxID=288992 RepID=A0A1M4UMD6_9SPHI|nr:AraC family transcriptional regulator [Pedobacter caeni]SHE57952.1 transcriptional regulator, AraC family [Pedobacter caeni]